MRDVYWLAIAAGVLFGLWPLFMNRSGLDGFASAFTFTIIAFLLIGPVALWSGQINKITLTPLLWFAILAGLCGGAGVLFFNTALAKVSPREVSIVFMIMLMFQLAVPAIYHMIQTGDYSFKRVAGVIGAFGVVYLLQAG